MIVIDASSVVGAAISLDSVPAHAVQRAFNADLVATSVAVMAEIEQVLNRPRLARFINPVLRDQVLTLFRS